MNTRLPWLHRLFLHQVVGFLTTVFPNTTTSATQHLLHHPEHYTQKTKKAFRKRSLEVIYKTCKNPQSSFAVFTLRVKHRGWDIAHALNTYDREGELSDATPGRNLREIYKLAPVRQVSYTAFYRRVTRRGWDIQKALTTPAYHYTSLAIL